MRNLLQISQPPLGTASVTFPRQGTRVRVRSVNFRVVCGAAVGTRTVVLEHLPAGMSVPNIFPAARNLIINETGHFHFASINPGFIDQAGAGIWVQACALPDSGLILEIGDSLAIDVTADATDQISASSWVFEELPRKA